MTTGYPIDFESAKEETFIIQYIDFQVIAREEDTDKVKDYKYALMKFIKEHSNFPLIFNIGNFGKIDLEYVSKAGFLLPYTYTKPKTKR